MKNKALEGGRTEAPIGKWSMGGERNEGGEREVADPPARHAWGSNLDEVEVASREKSFRRFQPHQPPFLVIPLRTNYIDGASVFVALLQNQPESVGEHTCVTYALI